MKLVGKVAIVTGGAQGLGKAYALRLAGEGARVVVADVLDSKGVQQEIEGKGGEALALHTDVSDEGSTVEMAKQTIERFGRIDILVNNAAIFADISRKPFFQITPGEWDQVMAVNIRGMFLCCKAVYPQMKKQGKGKIINVSSGTFFKGSPRLLLKARFPIIITSSIGRDPLSLQPLVEVAEAGAIGVVSFKPGYVNFPGDHPYHLGFSPALYFEEADVILVLDCDVPWFPKRFKPKESAVVIQAGIDPADRGL
ncbi:MAG: SDR family NAD(P)-dependent oxidoreductase [Deltaproteobacteria bacterium]|nr:SDR family NAD(P)-dependent oxidoreductase [Deltaproteobacteria bacterium]MBW2138930.1 SDR family NAD(P)-dependent oxidoreductase [Deltaproteobacteria bacterium]